jgi:hypothetical protein
VDLPVAFVLYNALIKYTMALRIRTGVAFTARCRGRADRNTVGAFIPVAGVPLSCRRERC